MSLILRETKGSELTIAELDGNFTYLDSKPVTLTQKYIQFDHDRGSNTVTSSKFGYISGESNIVETSDASFVTGSENVVENCQNSTVSGAYNKAYSSSNAIVKGQKNSSYMSSSTISLGDTNSCIVSRYSHINGYQNYCNGDFNINFGQKNYIYGNNNIVNGDGIKVRSLDGSYTFSQGNSRALVQSRCYHVTIDNKVNIPIFTKFLNPTTQYTFSKLYNAYVEFEFLMTSGTSRVFSLLKQTYNISKTAVNSNSTITKLSENFIFNNLAISGLTVDLVQVDDKYIESFKEYGDSTDLDTLVNVANYMFDNFEMVISDPFLTGTAKINLIVYSDQI